MRQLKECLEFAHHLGAKIVIVHPGALPGDYPRNLLSLSQESFIEGLRKTLRSAERLGMTLALENKPRGRNRGLVQFPEEHLSLVQQLDSANCKIAFDVGHAHTFGLDLIGYLEEVFPYLVEVHLHDNDGSWDQHRPPGAGTIELVLLLSALDCQGYRGPLILEMNSVEDLEQSLENLHQI